MVFTEPDKENMNYEDKTALQQVISWASGQPFNNVLLSAILGAIGWCGYWAISIGVPSHLRQIQDGYQQLHDQDRELIDRLEAQHREERKQILDTYDRWMDRQAAGKGESKAVAEQTN